MDPIGFIDQVFTSLKRILSDRYFIRKIGLIFGINFVLNAISVFISLLANATGFLETRIPEEMYSLVSMLFSTALPLLINILTIPVWIFAKGFLFKTADNLRNNDKENPLAETTDLKKLMQVGGVYLTINYTLTIPFAIVGILIVIVMFVFGGVGTSMAGGTMIQDTSSPYSSLYLFLGLFAAVFVVIILLSLVLFFIQNTLVPALMYVYFRKKKAISIFRVKNLFKIVQVSWSSWIIAVVILTFFWIVSFVINLILCCVGIFVSPILETLAMLLSAAIFGAIYYNLDQAGVEIE